MNHSDEYSESDAKLIDSLAGDELPLCSIEIKNEHARVIIDQSLDITVGGDPDEARKCVLFLFPKTCLGHEFVAGNMREVFNYGLNREAIKLLDENSSRTEGGDYLAVGVIDGYMLIFKAQGPAALLLGKLINDFRLAGGVDYFDKGQEARRGKR